MVDESDEVKAPILPVHSAAPVDEGLAAWANLVRDQIGMQGGVEMIGAAGGSVQFRFRGQTFSVTIQRTS
jgi:hypothetical protein